MKKLKLLVIIAALSFKGHSQNSKIDSTVIPDSQLIIALQKVELGKGCEVNYARLEKENKLLQNRIGYKDAIIDDFAKLVARDSLITKTYKSELSNLEQSYALAKADAAALQKNLKKQKRKTRLTGVAGLLGMAALTWLFIH